METSDSECFESADEDFEYDKKPTTIQTEGIDTKPNLETIADVTKKIEDIAIKTLQIDEKSSSAPLPLEVNSEKPNAIGKKNDKIQKREPKERTKKEIKPKLGQRIASKNIETGNNIPPKREECWEPGMNYIDKEESVKEESAAKIISSKLEDSWETDVSCSKDISANKLHESSESSIPKREECWEPGMDFIESDSDEKKFEKSTAHKRKESWEQEKDYIKIGEAQNIQLQNSTEKESKTEHLHFKEDEENMWGADDDWETLPNVKASPENVTESENKSTASGWGSWGNWGGVSSILSTATQSVSTLTSHVSQGITTVLESGMGVPDPEELARIHKSEQAVGNTSNEEDEEPEPTIQTVFGLGNLVSGVSHITKLVESTSNKVLTGGLDTLEVIGKKTMEVLQDGDPGLKKKRAFLKIEQNKPILSQILREAKEKAEEENKLMEERHFQKKANYETLFDDNQGLVHLEALEMLSKQCDIKLETIMSTYSAEQLKEIQETMNQIKELCEIPEEDEEEQLTNDEIKEKLDSAIADLNVPISYDRFHCTWQEAEEWLSILNLDICNERELHQQAIETLAHLTALAVEQYHKAGELLLIKEHRSTADEADSLVQLTTTLTSLISIAAAKFSEKLNLMAAKAKNPKLASELITNVFLEAANSSTYIKDAFQLLIPVLQVGAL